MQHHRSKPYGSCIDNLPDRQAIVTLKSYTNAISTLTEGKAYIRLINGNIDCILKDGRIFENGSPVNEQRVEEVTGLTKLEEIDLPLLRTLYSIYLDEYLNNEVPNPNITIYFPDLLKMMGARPNTNKQQIEEVINKINKFNDLIGVIEKTDYDRKRCNYYAVLNFEKYEEETNLITVSSPYMEKLITLLKTEAIARDKEGRPVIQKNNVPQIKPTHSYLIKSSIASERNKTAVENVNIIVTLIERCGNQLAHISAQTLVDSNPLLKKRLEDAPNNNKQRILNTTFKRTWELLREKTDLLTTYKDIVLPIDEIPKLRQLKKTVYSFPHKGKRKCIEDEKECIEVEKRCIKHEKKCIEHEKWASRQKWQKPHKTGRCATSERERNASNNIIS